jgi:hypothetical protein
LIEVPLDKDYEYCVTLTRDKPIQGNDSLRKIDEKTGEIQDGRTARAERYALQSSAKKILPKERVGKCMRYPIPYQNVEIHKHRKTLKSFYCNLGVCGSVWMCPVCSAKISERRRIEMKTATELHKQDGGYLAMITLTVRHNNGDKLYEKLERLTIAKRSLTSGKRWDALKTKINLLGTIRAFETTHGKNGWHPHYHVLLFFYNKQDLDQLGTEIYELWEAACRRSGLEASGQGFKIQGADEASDYVSKWGIDYEMTKSQTKRGGGEKGRTPFDILRDYLYDSKKSDEILFKIYAEAFKGKNQLFWSRGLKKQFEVVELDDQTIVQKTEEQADFLFMVSPEVWQAVYRKKLQSTLLELSEDLPIDLAIDEIKKMISIS